MKLKLQKLTQFTLTKLLLGTLAVCAVTVNAKASDGSGAHGGEVVFCSGADPKPMFLDYFDAKTYRTLDGKALDLIDVDSLSAAQVVDLIRARLKPYAFGDQFDQVLKVFGPIGSWEARKNLNAMYDANEPYSLPDGCTKVTLTARQDRHLIVDPEIRAKITDGQFGVMIAHEAFFYYGENRANLQTSENIRILMRELLKADVSTAALEQAILSIRGSLTHYSDWPQSVNLYPVCNGRCDPDSPAGSFGPVYPEKQAVDFASTLDPAPQGGTWMLHYQCDALDDKCATTDGSHTLELQQGGAILVVKRQDTTSPGEIQLFNRNLGFLYVP